MDTPIRRRGVTPRALASFAALIVATSSSAARADGKGDAKAACSAAADRGQSQRDEGAYRAARASFARCAQEDCPRIVARACGDWLRDLDAASPTIVVGAKDARGADVTDARVEMDGAPIAGALGGQPIAADPGTHRLHFVAKDGAVADEKITLRAGEKNRLVVVTLANPDPGAAASPPAPAPESDARDAAPESAPSSSEGGGGGARVAVGVTFTVLAVAGAAVGTYFLVDSMHQGNVADGLRAPLGASGCSGAAPDANCGALSDAVDAQHRDTKLGAVAFGAAGAFAIGAIATWLLWTPSPAGERATTALSVAPSVAPGAVGLRLGGSF